MNASKITQVHIYLIGGVLMLIVGVGLFFMLLKPLHDQNAQLRASIATTDSTTVQLDGQGFTIAQVDAAQKKLEDVRVRRQAKEANLAAIEARKQLPRSQQIDLGDGSDPQVLAITMPRWLNLPRTVVRQMENYAQRTARRRGVTVTTTFAAPAPSTDPKAIPRDIIAWNLGSMTVTGPFDRVMQWVEDWNNAPLLVSVDGLKCVLDGRGGRIKATSTLTTYIFPTGKGVQNPGAGGAPGGAPGMPGGMPGAEEGMEGMPAGEGGDPAAANGPST